MATVERELAKPDLSPAERKELIDEMVEFIKMRDAKDTENKRFLVVLSPERMTMALRVAGGVGVVALATVAGLEVIKQLGKLALQVAKKAMTS